MEEVREYKCPCCGGAIVFDTQVQKMKCPFCDTEFEVDSLSQYDEILKSEKPDKTEWENNERKTVGTQDGLCSYICNSCGGEIVCDETTSATSCPYCGNPVTLSNNLSGFLKPDLVIPFKYDKSAAKQALFNHYKGKKLLPDAFLDENHIDEIKGVYIPVWLYDAQTDANVRYRATRTRAWSDSRYDYVETSYYSVSRAGTIDFAAVPVDGSQKMPDDLMESVEPFDVSAAVDFQTAYLSGFFADKYDVDSAQSEARANDRMKASTERAFRGTVSGYESVTPENTNIRFQNGKVRYALYPFWLLTTSWKGNSYRFAMNGQTGKFVGNLPADTGKSWKYFGIFAGITTLVVAAAQAAYFLWQGGVL